MTALEFIRQFPEKMPGWLEKFNADSDFSSELFFDSRIVFYPGSGFDGQPIRLFGSAHAAHTFIYADYGESKEALQNEIYLPGRGFKGYQIIFQRDLTQKQINPKSWAPHITRWEMHSIRYGFSRIQPFAWLVILERNVDRDDSHGPKRLAILFLGADGVASYDALFCQATEEIPHGMASPHPGHDATFFQERVKPPFAIVVQDHGFGGNYTSFGENGLLAKIAKTTGSFPEWLLMGRNSTPWEGYERVPDVDPDFGERAPWFSRRFYRRQVPTHQSSSLI